MKPVAEFAKAYDKIMSAGALKPDVMYLTHPVYHKFLGVHLKKKIDGRNCPVCIENRKAARHAKAR